MGGALIIIALVTATLLWCDLTSPLIWPALLVTVGLRRCSGFVDDYIKIVKKNKKGRRRPGSSCWCSSPSAPPPSPGCSGAAAGRPSCGPRLSVPLLDFDRIPIELPLALYFVLGLIVVVGMSNGVNLTDGLDGLAIGPVIISSFTFLLLAYATGTIAGRLQHRRLPGHAAHRRGRASWPCSAAPSAARASGSSGSTPTPPRCSWATSARWRWGARWGSWRWPPRPSCRCRSSAACSSSS